MTKYVLGANFLICIIYLIYYPDSPQIGGLSRVVPWVLHCTLLFIIAVLLFLSKKSKLAWSFVLSALVLIGSVLFLGVLLIYVV